MDILKLIEKFTSDCNDIMSFVEKEQKNYDAYFDDYTKRIVRTEFGAKGLYVPRGYYCPSKTIDVISNVKRGKLTKRGAYDFVYNFDENGKLIFVRRSNAKACEFIKWEDNIEIGITFRRRNRIEAVTICEFYEDGKIKQYSHYSRYGVEEKNMQLKKETYEYNKHNTVVRVVDFIPRDVSSIGRELFCDTVYTFSKINENEFQYVSKQLYPKLAVEFDIVYHVKRVYPF